MRLKINLAQKPFYNRKLFWISFLVIMTSLFFIGQWTMEKIEQTKSVSLKMKDTIKKQELELKALQKQATTPVQPLTLDQIKEIKDAAELIKERNFSWTSMLEEFERSLPEKIRVVSISPSKDTPSLKELSFKIKIYAKSVEDLTKMIEAMDKDGVFKIQPLTQESPLQTGDIGYSLNVVYKPRPPQIKATKKTKAENKLAVKDEDEDE